MASPTPTRRATTTRDDATDRDRRFTRDDAASDDALGEPVAVPRGSWRDRMRSNPGTRQVYQLKDAV